MRLTGQQRKTLREAIIAAYPKREDLEVLLVEEMQVKSLDAIAGGKDYNIQVFNLIGHFENKGNLDRFIQAIQSRNPDIDIPEEEIRTRSERRRVGNLIYQDHKQGGDLVSLTLYFNEPENTEEQNISFGLDIAFAEANMDFSYNPRGSTRIRATVRIGVKYGKLHITFRNASLRLEDRKFLTCNKHNWTVSSVSVSEDAPFWLFKSKKAEEVMLGLLTGQELGRVTLSDSCTASCCAEAAFKTPMPRKDIVITEQDGLWNDDDEPKVKETKKGYFYARLVRQKFEEYISKVEVQYDSINNP